VHRTEHVRGVARLDSNLGLVVALANRALDLRVKARFQTALEVAIHRSDLVRYGWADLALGPVPALILDELPELEHAVDEAFRAWRAAGM